MVTIKPEKVVELPELDGDPSRKRNLMPLNSSVYPTHRTAAACEAKGCLVSISLGASEAHRDLAIEAYRWATMRYPEVTVCLGDGPLVESTLRTLGCSQQQAIERGCELAHHSLDALNAVKPVASLLAASELATTDSFKDKQRQVARAYGQDAKLRAAVGREAERYVLRLQRQGRLGVSLLQALAMARDYILFEIAIYAHLAERGYWLDLYAGEELGVLKMFMRGHLTGFPELAKRACISVKPGR